MPRWILVLLVAGCAGPTYDYRFDLRDGAATSGPTQGNAPGAAAAPAPTAAANGVFEDATIRAALAVQGDAIALDVTNKTDAVVQIGWDHIALDRGDGTRTRLRPAADLGWLQPGASASAQLVPLAFPRTGDAARAYDGRTLTLDVPAVVRTEPTTYHFHFAVHVAKHEKK
ncbi:MAG TPA: hypothetical protein VGM88_29045 [Kofleriaceae bacterium]|jgi:hypothetical protein